MRKLCSLLTLGLLMAVSAIVAIAPHAEAAQRRNQNLPKLLVVPPMPQDRADSAFAVQAATQSRLWLSGRLRSDWRVVETDEYCEALELSGFPCGFLLDDNSAEQLARFLQVDAYVVGELRRNSAPGMSARVVDLTGRSGLSGWVTIVGEPDQEARKFGELLGDSIRNLSRVAGDARECLERRDRQDFDDARARADRVFRVYPNHPSTAMCIATMFENNGAPVDSVIFAYSKAVAGDSLNVKAWQRLAAAYLVNSDTANAVTAFKGQLAADPSDETVRVGVIRTYLEVLEEYDSARVYAEQGMEVNPSSLQLVRLWGAACGQASNWECTIASYEREFELDNAMVNDSTFYMRILGAADFAQDTARLIDWSGKAAVAFPQSLRFLSQHAGALSSAGMTDSSVAVYSLIVQRDPTNVAALLAIASSHAGRLVIDSVRPEALDTMLMNEIDSILTRVVEISSEPRVQGSVAILYYGRGLLMAQNQFYNRNTIHWLGRSLELPLADNQRPIAGYFHSLASLQYLFGWYNDEVKESNDCSMATEFGDIARAAKASAETAATDQRFRAAAGQLLPNLDQLIAAETSLREVFECGTGN